MEAIIYKKPVSVKKARSSPVLKSPSQPDIRLHIYIQLLRVSFTPPHSFLLPLRSRIPSPSHHRRLTAPFSLLFPSRCSSPPLLPAMACSNLALLDRCLPSPPWQPSSLSLVVLAGGGGGTVTRRHGQPHPERALWWLQLRRRLQLPDRRALRRCSSTSDAGGINSGGALPRAMQAASTPVTLLLRRHLQRICGEGG